MTKKISTLMIVMFCAVYAFAQNSFDVPSYNGTTSTLQDDDKKTEDGDSYFPPKPKHGTEIGIHGGHAFIHGDVYARPGWGIGLHVRRAINYTISWRLHGVYANSFSLEDRSSRLGYVTSDDNEGSGIQLSPADYQALGYNLNSPIYRNSKTTLGWGSFHIIGNLTNILFHKKAPKWNIYVFAGPTMLYYKSKYNLLNGDAVYRSERDNSVGQWVVIPTTDNSNEFFNRDKLKAIKSYLDDSYETEARYGNGNTDDNGVPGYQSFNLLGRDNFALMPSLDWGFGVSRKITDRINIAVEHQAMISLNDDIDGYVAGRNVDVPHYTNVKLNFNLMKSDAVEPLYWVNPLDFPMKKMKEIEDNLFVVKDEDGDGVLDELDEEPDTVEGALVDTKGRTLDSDGDGIADHEDKEPYTPYNLISEVDDKGVAPTVEACEPCLTKEDIISIGKGEGWHEKPAPVTTTSECSGDWFLPMIHFDLDKHNLKPEAKAQLHHIAQVMKRCPNLCVVAVGHTDRLNNNAYNQTLSYNRAKTAVDYLTQVYGISSSRLVINYGGEETPLVDTNGSSYINRRVEFRICAGEGNMGAPSGDAVNSSNSSSGFGTSGDAPVKY